MKGSVSTIASPEPAFRRVARDLRAQILTHAFGPDTPLPTEADIAGNYAVSRQTVRRAFQDLVAEGLVFRVPGRGTFATPPSARYLRQFGSIDDLMALSTDSELQVVDPLAPTVDPSAAGRLQLSDDRVFAVTFVRRHHGAVFCHTTVFLPPSAGARLEGADELSKPGAVNRVTVIGMLDDALPGRIQEADQSISVAPASSDVADALGTSPSTALLRIDRTYFDTDALPVELAISHFLPERYSYRVRLRRALS